MIRFFGLPIILALILGYFIPYYGLKSSPYAFVVLFLMMTFSSLDIKWTYLKDTLKYKKELSLGLFLLYLFFPLAQWLLAKYLVRDESFVMGLILGSICPIALVAPNFTKLHRANESLTFIIMIFSMLIFPFLLFPLNLDPQFKVVLIDMLLLIFLPVLIATVLNILFKKVATKLKTIATQFNMVAISILAFIYLGSAISKLNLEYTPYKELLGMVAVLLFQDFGVFFLSRLFLRNLFEQEISDSLSISISMKNIAVSGGILLFVDPKASMASALGFLIHALFFNYLALKIPKEPIREVSLVK